MKFFSFVRHSESYRNGPPPAGFMEVMDKFVQDSFKDGSLVDTGGLKSSGESFRVRLSGGKITATDGPFTEAKEIIGGWAIIEAPTKAEALKATTAFLELHRKNWPGFEGECEVRPMFDPVPRP